MAKRPLATKDNASGQLNAGISAGSGSIVLKTGEGANFPAIARASATSLGSTALLNSTGIQAALAAVSAAVGDIIENVTDGSWAVIKSISTDSIQTTRLQGGSDNTWQNSDVWAVNRFVLSLVNYDVDGETVLKRERVLIGNRSTDTLTVETVPGTGRGYDSSSAQSFSADDYAYLFNTSAVFDGLKVAVADIARVADAAISAAGSEIYGASSGGTDAYAITVIPSITAYTDGMTFRFKADVGNTDAATLNVNGIGAKTIKKQNDQDLASGDIEAAQVVEVMFNSADDVFEMSSQLASSGGVTATDVLNQAPNYAADSGAANAYVVTLSPAAAGYTAGMKVVMKAANANTGASTVNVNGLGAKNIYRPDGTALVGGEIRASQLCVLEYDGTQFQLVSWSPFGLELIGAVLGAGSSTSLDLQNLSPRRAIKIVAHLEVSSGYPQPLLRFNNDSGNNYCRKSSRGGGAEVTSNSQSSIDISDGGNTGPMYIIAEVANRSGKEKLVLSRSVAAGGTGAATATERTEMGAKWANTAAQISRVTIVNGQAGNWTTDSFMYIFALPS